jgi:hypothetical protein
VIGDIKQWVKRYKENLKPAPSQLDKRIKAPEKTFEKTSGT